MKTESHYFGNILISENEEDTRKLKEIVKAFAGILLGGYEGEPYPVSLEYDKNKKYFYICISI